MSEVASPVSNRALNFERGFARAVIVLNAIGTVCTVAMVCVMVMDVLGRLLFRQPVPGTNEIVEMLIVAVLFLQVTNALRNNGLARSDILERYLCRVAPAAVPFLNLFFAALGAAVFAVLLWAIVPVLLRDIATNSLVGVRGVFLFPEWPLRVIVLVGCVAMIIQFVLTLLAEGARILKGRQSE